MKNICHGRSPNHAKDFKILFKTQSKIVPNPENYILEIRNNQFASKPSTKFLGIYLDSAITYEGHISKPSSKIDFYFTPDALWQTTLLFKNPHIIEK